MWTHTWRDAPDGPWIIQDGDDDPTDFDHVRSFLLNTRYWWLEGVDTAKLRKGIDKILSKHDIETIAPGYGCILRGKKTVAKHMQLVDDVLKSLDKSVAVSRYVGRDEERVTGRMAARHQGTLNRPNPLPREVAPGIFWLGECLEQRQQGKIYHGCNASFLIVGETASMLVETGHPKDFPITEAQLNTLLPGGRR